MTGMEQPAGDAFVYDVLNYPSPVIQSLTPDHIAAAGLVFGWEAPDPATASVLEIGCGDGLNLVAVGATWPRTRCVGFDLSPPQIEIGRAVVRNAGLDNVDLQVGDILTWPRDGEKFDYVLAHGVHTWVPHHVQDALLELIGARLKPGGIAYVSYDCLPAAAPKQAIISFLASRVGDIADFEQRIIEALRLVTILARSQSHDSRLKPTLDGLMERMRDYPRAYFFHDWLSENYLPRTLGGFARDADRAGLEVIGDAELGDLFVADLDEDARRWIIAEARDAASQGALLDMLRGTQSFRRTLLTRKGALLPAAWDGIRRLRYSFLGSREEAVRQDGPAVRYRAPGHVEMTTSADYEIAVIDALHATGGDELTFAEIVAETGMSDLQVEQVLRQMASIGLAEIHVTPPPFTLTPGDRPRAGRLVRALLAERDWAINLRHLRISAESPATRMLLVLCDGTRDRDELARSLSEAFDTTVTRERIDDGIDELAHQYCFEA